MRLHTEDDFAYEVVISCDDGGVGGSRSVTHRVTAIPETQIPEGWLPMPVETLDLARVPLPPQILESFSLVS